MKDRYAESGHSLQWRGFPLERIFWMAARYSNWIMTRTLQAERQHLEFYRVRLKGVGGLQSRILMMKRLRIAVFATSKY